MDCTQFEEKVIDYFIDTDLDWKIRYGIDQHAISCDECSKKFEIASMVTDRRVMKRALQDIEIEEMITEFDSLFLKENHKEAKELFNKIQTIAPDNPELAKRSWLTVQTGSEKHDIHSLREPKRIDVPIEETVTIYRNNVKLGEFELEPFFKAEKRAGGFGDSVERKEDITTKIYEDEQILIETYQGIKGNFLIITPKK